MLIFLTTNSDSFKSIMFILGLPINSATNWFFGDLCEKLSRVASRSTIQAILIDGVDRTYLSKSIDQNDKRKKYFSCENIKGELDLWYKNNKAIYN